MPMVIHFEICVEDLTAAADFYTNVFGWKIEQLEGGPDYWFISTGSGADRGITGGLTRRFDDLHQTINTIEVPSLDSFAKKITEEGGKVLGPKLSIPGEGYVQYCHDPEGNTFGLMELDNSAT